MVLLRDCALRCATGEVLELRYSLCLKKFLEAVMDTHCFKMFCRLADGNSNRLLVHIPNNAVVYLAHLFCEPETARHTSFVW